MWSRADEAYNIAEAAVSGQSEKAENDATFINWIAVFCKDSRKITILQLLR